MPNTCTCYCNRFCSQCPIVFIRLSLSLAQTFYLWRLPNIMNSEVSEWSIFSKNIENFRNAGALPPHPRGGPRPLDPRRGTPPDPRIEPPSIQSWLRAWVVCLDEVVCLYAVVCLYEIVCPYAVVCLCEVVCLYAVVCLYEVVCLYAVVCLYEVVCLYGSITVFTVRQYWQQE